MRFVDTIEGPADPIGEFVSAEQPLGLDHLSLTVDPFGFDWVEPRTLFGKQAQGTILTPRPLFLTSRLWAAIQLRT